MYARLLTAFCLLATSLSGHSRMSVDDGVEVYFKNGGGLSPAVLAEIKIELASLMRGVGVRVGWWIPQNAIPVESGARLIVADFQGSCAAASLGFALGGADASRLPPLARTSISDSRILPFAHVDCATLDQFVGPFLVSKPAATREHLYGRAIGRLLAHECYHIVAQTREHAGTGVAKEHFSTRDLLSDHFEFESALNIHPAKIIRPLR